LEFKTNAMKNTDIFKILNIFIQLHLSLVRQWYNLTFLG